MDITVEMLQKGINVMQKGEYWISRELQKKLLERCLDVKENKLPALTQREKEIIELICEGLSNKEIATKLSVSENTVKATLNRIYKKYKISSRTQLVKFFK
jgi:RNA polymerase sigma factor (sigma-70 family)